MGKLHLSGLSGLWHSVQALIYASGAPGLAVLSFLDSTILPFPTANDLMLVDLSIRTPLRMPIYAAFATVGSVMGCIALFAVARKGEQIAVHEKSARMQRVHRWIEGNGFWGVVIGALLPPPMPFKLVVLVAGALEMPLRSFVLAVLLARALRFYGEGVLAVRYGDEAVQLLSAHRVAFGLISVASLLLFYLAFRVVLSGKRRPA